MIRQLKSATGHDMTVGGGRRGTGTDRRSRHLSGLRVIQVISVYARLSVGVTVHTVRRVPAIENNSAILLKIDRESAELNPSAQICVRAAQQLLTVGEPGWKGP
jgi:hypothetical protein